MNRRPLLLSLFVILTLVASGATLLGFGLFALLWNAVLIVLAVNAGLDLLGGQIDWLLLGILVPFLVVGIAGNRSEWRPNPSPYRHHPTTSSTT